MIELWLAHFSALLPHLPRYTLTLTADERARADRYIDAGVRARFILARGMLRHVLGAALGVSPAAVPLAYGGRGKPYIPGGTVNFNLSHADDLLALGVVSGRAIGVDVERVRPMAEMHTVARMNFSPAEQAAFFKLPASQQPQAFYTAWTRKEAYIKAVGDGFALPLKDFDVTLTPDTPARLLRAEGDNPERWALIHITPGPGYVGAICISAPPPPVQIKPFIEHD